MNRSGALVYSFDDFRRDVSHRVRLLSRRLRDPDSTWPCALLLDIPDQGLSIETFELAGSAPRERSLIAMQTIPALIAASRPRRVCWVMPVWRQAGQARQECLLLVFAERGRCEASLAAVYRDGASASRLGRWDDGPVGAGVRRVGGLFVEAIIAALDEEAA